MKEMRSFSRNICRFFLWIQLNLNVRVNIFILSFVSRETKVAEVAEKLCLRTTDCLIILLNNNPLKITNMFMNQINALVFPFTESTGKLVLLCPNCVTKTNLVVNVWNSRRKSLLFGITKTKCCNPLEGIELLYFFIFLNMLDLKTICFLTLSKFFKN